MSPDDNAVIAQRFGQAWTAGNLALVDELGADDLEVDYPALGDVIHGREAFQAVLVQWHAAFPDSERSDEDVVACGDRAAVAWTVRGTHRGDLWGVPPSGRSVSMRGVSLYRIAAGKVVQDRGVGDALTLMRQIGVVAATDS